MESMSQWDIEGQESEKLAELLHGLYMDIVQTRKQNSALATRVAELEGDEQAFAPISADGILLRASLLAFEGFCACSIPNFG